MGHLGLLIPPAQLEAMGISPAMHVLLAKVIGGLGGVMALVGMLILIGRRLIDRSVKVGNFVVKLPMRSLSYLDDYFADALLLLIILLGLIQTLWLESVEPGFFEYSVAPWIWNLASFNVDKAISYIMAAPPITLAHVILAMIFIAYFPWGQDDAPILIHIHIAHGARPSIKIRVKSIPG